MEAIIGVRILNLTIRLVSKKDLDLLDLLVAESKHEDEKSTEALRNMSNPDYVPRSIDRSLKELPGGIFIKDYSQITDVKIRNVKGGIEVTGGSAEVELTVLTYLYEKE